MSKRMQMVRLTGSAALLAFGLVGCMMGQDKNQYGSNGENAFIKEESENIGQVWNGEASPLALTKTARDSVKDTITGDWVLVPLHYDAACQCFIRTADFTNSVGYERRREDTITLFDANDKPMEMFHPGEAARISHKRHVHRINPLRGKEVDVNFNTTMTWHNDSNGTHLAGVWNGTVTGSFNGVVFRTGSINEVVRNFHPAGLRRFGFPVSGNIHMERVILGVTFKIDIVFEGEGKATATITNTKNGNVRVIHIDVDNKERG